MTAQKKSYVGGSSALELWRLLAERKASSRNEGAPRARRHESGRQGQTTRRRKPRRAAGVGPLGLRFVREDSLPDRFPDDGLMADMLAHELDGLSLPVQLLAPTGTARRPSQLKRCLRWPHSLPPRCLLGISRRARLCSPEFCFLQMARSLNLIDLIELGFELCGSYSLPAHGGDGHFEREPLTTQESIRATIDRLPGAHSSDLARRALNYVLDGSASPAETKLCMLLDHAAINVLGSDLARRLGVRRRTDSYDVEERRRQLHVRLTVPLRKMSGGWVPAEDDSARLASWPELR